jgi:hypothetical protein
MVALAKDGTREEDESPLFAETCWPMSDVHKHVPIAPKGGSLIYWAVRGCVNRFTRQRVYLETIFIPLGRATSAEAISRFLKRLNAKAPTRTIPATRAMAMTRRQRRKKKKSA